MAGSNASIVDDVTALHPSHNGAINNYRAHEVAHVRCFAARTLNVHACVAQVLKYGLGSFNERLNYFAWNQVLVAPNRRAQQDGPCSPDAQQVVGVHDYGVLGDSAPHAEVTCFLPVEVGERRLGARSVGMHHQTVICRAAQRVRNNFAKRVRKQPFVNCGDRLVNFFFA